MKFKKLLLAAAVSSLTLSGVAFAGSGHDSMGHGSMDHGSMNKSAMNMSAMSDSSMGNEASKKKMFLKEKNIDGYKVSFHVMDAKGGMDMGGSHNLMIKVEQAGVVVADVKINSKVVHPDGVEESKSLMKMGDWQAAGYDLGHAGKHQLMVLFKTADGKKHFGGIRYDS